MFYDYFVCRFGDILRALGEAKWLRDIPFDRTTQLSSTHFI